MPVWMTLCSILVNGAAAGLFYYELHKHGEKYPARQGGKLPGAALPYSVLMMIAAVGLSLFITLFYGENTFLFTLKRVVMLALLWPVAYTDLTAYRIPNLFIAAGLTARTAILAAEFIWERDALFPCLLTEVIAAAVLFLVALLCTVVVKNSIGGGDMKLFVVMGLLLGVQGTWGAIFLSLIVSFIVAVALLVTRKKSRKDAIPFGPALAVGTYLSIFLTGM